jgi:hypothetical protein
LSPIINALIRLPAEIQLEANSRGAGLIYESPQTFMVWGIVYFSLNIILEIYLGYENWKKPHNNSQHP